MDSRKLFFLLLSLILTLNLAATKIKVGVLPVGVIGNAPFVIENNKNLTGISIALWERLADLENLNYSFVYFKSMPDAIDAASKGDVKALIGPISITKTRAEKVSFSQPYFRSGLGIAVRNTSPGLFEKFMPFLKTGLLVIFLSILPLLFLVGLFIWLSERKTNSKHFPKNPYQGLMAGMWFALVTMTTVGYGDKSPTTMVGKLISSLWMLIGVILMSTITAAVTTSLTLSSLPTSGIIGPLDLRKERVAVVAGTTAVKAVYDYHAYPSISKDLAQAIDKLINKQAEAVVFDKTILQYYLSQNDHIDAHVIDAEFDQQNYGIAFPISEKELMHATNLALLGIMERGELEPIVRKWVTNY